MPGVIITSTTSFGLESPTQTVGLKDLPAEPRNSGTEPRFGLGKGGYEEMFFLVQTKYSDDNTSLVTADITVGDTSYTHHTHIIYSRVNYQDLERHMRCLGMLRIVSQLRRFCGIVSDSGGYRYSLRGRRHKLEIIGWEWGGGGGGAQTWAKRGVARSVPPSATGHRDETI